MPICPHSTQYFSQVKIKLFMLLHSHYNKVFGHDDVSTVWCLPWSGDVHDGREECVNGGVCALQCSGISTR